MKLPIIDADCHVVEPFELWATRLPEEYRDRARRRVVDESGHEQLFHEGKALDLEWSVGSLSTPGSASAQGRLDIDLDSEVDAGVHDPVRRLEVMDEQGIGVSVLFPSQSLGLDDVSDDGLRHAYAITYNRWIAEFCEQDPIRLRWGAVLPVRDLDWAVAELERVLAAGCTAVMLSPIPRSRPTGHTFASPERQSNCRNLGHSDMDPVWRRLQEADVPAVVHSVNPASNSLGMGWLWANRTQWQMGQPFQMQLAILHVIDGGVLERFPGLGVGFFEGDVGWLPHWLGRLEETYEKFALLSNVPTTSPIEQFRRQCVISGEPADLGLALTARLVGADRVLWASDWPHMDGAWPDPLVLLRDRADLSEDQKRDIFMSGAARFFGIDLDRLAAHLGTGWSLSTPIEELDPMLRMPSPALQPTGPRRGDGV